MPTLKTGDSQLYYEVHGAGPTVVLAHGAGGNHAIWYKQIVAFARSYQVIVFDHRGFGNSTDAEGLGRSAYVDDLKALLDQLHIAKAALVGQSMGGGTVVGFSSAYPGRVHALVIADSLHGFIEPEDVKAIMDKARLATAALPQLDRVLGAKFRAQNPSEALLYSELSSFNETDRRSLKGEYAIRTTAEDLAALQIPILFLAGMDDPVFPIEAIRKLQERAPGSFLVELYEAGHSAFFERPSEFNDSILSFLAMAGVKGAKPAAYSNAAGYTPIKS